MRHTAAAAQAPRRDRQHRRRKSSASTHSLAYLICGLPRLPTATERQRSRQRLPGLVHCARQLLTVNRPNCADFGKRLKVQPLRSLSAGTHPEYHVPSENLYRWSGGQITPNHHYHTPQF